MLQDHEDIKLRILLIVFPDICWDAGRRLSTAELEASTGWNVTKSSLYRRRLQNGATVCQSPRTCFAGWNCDGLQSNACQLFAIKTVNTEIRKVRGVHVRILRTQTDRFCLSCLFNDAVSELKRKDDQWIMNRKGRGGTEENHEAPQSG
jgi:hypothetical protein